MNFVNLTQHVLNIFNNQGEEVKTLKPSGNVARVETNKVYTGRLGGVPTVDKKPGAVTGLPEAQNGVVYVVSGMVEAEVDRADVYSPGELMRDDNGRPIGCKGLSQTGQQFRECTCGSGYPWQHCQGRDGDTAYCG